MTSTLSANSVPALPPPNGAVSDFITPEDRGRRLFVVATVLQCLTIIFYASRVYAKVFIYRKLAADDSKQKLELSRNCN